MACRDRREIAVEAAGRLMATGRRYTARRVKASPGKGEHLTTKPFRK
jgi:hypothetical protein